MMLAGGATAATWMDDNDTKRSLIAASFHTPPEWTIVVVSLTAAPIGNIHRFGHNWELG